MERGLPNEEAAEIRTVTGWVCKTCGLFFGSGAGAERMARYCHETDHVCGAEDCTNRAKRPYIYCDTCIEKRSLERWQKLPEEEWDEETPLYLDDVHIFTPDDLIEYLEENEAKVEDLRFVICEEDPPPCFEINEFLQDLLPPDDCFSAEEVEGIEKAVADWIKENVRPVWVPGKKRPTLESLQAIVKAYAQ